MKHLILLFGIILSTLLISACTVSSKDTLIVTEPLSTAAQKVERLVSGEEEAQVIINEAPSSIAILPFDNDTEEEIAPALLRRVMHSHLSGLNLRVIHPDDVDSKMPVGAVDTTKLANYFGVEAVLLGRVTEYRRFYAGIYTQNTLGVALELYNLKGEKIWFTESSVTQRAGGLSTSPWGLLLSAAVAALRMDNESLLSVADELGRKVARAMPQPEAGIVSQGPNIEQVIHDRPGKAVKYGDVISVGLKGEASANASVTLGSYTRVVLDEVEPGVYLGEITVDPDWNGERVPIRGHLQNSVGQTTTQISGIGLIRLDNIPPEQVTELTGSLTSKTLKLSWQGVQDATAYRVMITGPDGAVQSLETKDTFLTQALQTEVFSRQAIEVFSLDDAKNQGQPDAITLTSYPQEVGKQVYLSGLLQGDYQGINILTQLFSPYQVKGPVVFDSSSELYVEPGVVLQFDPKATISVQGTGNFWGNVEQPIVFSPINEGVRNNTYLTIDSDNAVQISGAQFVNGGVGVDIKNGAVLLEVVEFIDTRFSAISASGEAHVVVRQCLIDGSNTSGVVVSEFAQLSINDCTLKNNRPFHIQNASNYEVDAEDNMWEPAPSTTSVLGNVKVTK